LGQLRSIGEINNLCEFRSAARKNLPKRVFDYADGGADDEWSLSQNISAHNRYALVPHLKKKRLATSSAVEFLGSPLGLPIILSPVGGLAVFHPKKEYAVIGAASKYGAMFTLSIVGTISIEEAALIGNGPKMFQIYLQKDRGATADMVSRCKQSGFAALAITVDAPVAGKRERDIRNRFRFQDRSSLTAILDFVRKPRWSVDMLSASPFCFPNLKGKDGRNADAGSVAEILEQQFESDIIWEDISWLAKIWDGPLIVKGILNGSDAAQAIQCGASAVMLSNHGGRQLDGTVSPVDVIDEVRQSIGQSGHIIVDGGIRRGSHVLKSLALGADICALGRPYVFALAAGGEAGVDRLFEIMSDEITRNLTLLGCARIQDIGRHHVRRFELGSN
jgi:L-lactate dehydrogenase (cytochrome)